MNIKLIVILICFLGHSTLGAQTPESVVKNVSKHWLELHNDFKLPSDVLGNYTLDLTLEAMLFFDHYTKSNTYSKVVLDVFNKRKIEPNDTINYRTQPFCSINYSLGTITGNKNWYTGFIYETLRMYKNELKSKEGGILINHEGGHYILMDYLQEYASRLAKTGYLTHDSLLFRESVDQFLIYEKLLRNESTGLWCQGRGWCNDKNKLSQGSWSRGHGWLLRGIVTTMLYLPKNQRAELQPVLERVCYSLLKVQSKSGMYHILLHLPFDKSVPDVSGTGMIAYYMTIATKNGWLNENDFKPGILNATKALKTYVTEKGEILNSSKGPGPLCEPDEYINYQPEVDEKHGFQGVIYGMIAEILLRE